MNSNYQTYIYRTFLVLGLLMGGFGLTLKADTLRADSIGVEYKNGQKIVIHRLEAKETYFGLGRYYGVAAKDIIAANNNKPLKLGDTIRIPVGTAQQAANTANTTTQQQSAQVPVLAQGEYTQYKVGKGETLYTISKRFIISVESIKRANGLTSDTVKMGTILKIPNKELPPPPPTASQVMVPRDTASTDTPLVIPENRYGIREMTEKGVGVWMDDLSEGNGSMLALHKTAPIGTVMKITNPMTSRTALIKVVGKFADTAETKDAIVVISKSAASLIGVLDRRFQVELTYGTPNEPN